MDPNVTLENLRKRIKALASILNNPEDLLLRVQTSEDVGEAIEIFEALDEWLKKGGALPSDWNIRRGPKKAP